MGYPIGVPIVSPLKKYRPEQMTVKDLKSKIRGWKKKKLLQINVPKTCELRRMKANFWKKILRFLFGGACCISKCKFSKYFWDH